MLARMNDFSHFKFNALAPFLHSHEDTGILNACFPLSFIERFRVGI